MRNRRYQPGTFLIVLATVVGIVIWLSGCNRQNVIVGVTAYPEETRYRATDDPCIRIKIAIYGRVYRSGEIARFERPVMENLCLSGKVKS